MSKLESFIDNPSAQRLIKHWAERYFPDLSFLPADKHHFPSAELVNCASQAGRKHTIDQLQALLSMPSKLPGIDASFQLTDIPDGMSVPEARQLVPYIEGIYDTMFEIYQQQNPLSTYLQCISVSRDLFSRLALSSLMLPTPVELADMLAPALSNLKNACLGSHDSRTLSLITTQFHVTTNDLLGKITPCEQVLIEPLFKFVEEQLCIPWQRVCDAAARSPDPDRVSTIEQLMPQVEEIAYSVFERAVHYFPHYSSWRGALNQPDVVRSTMRDLIMVQSYFYLSILEESTTVIEQELLPFCLAVFHNVRAQWFLVEWMMQSLEGEIASRLAPAQLNQLSPYLQALQDIFIAADPERNDCYSLDLKSDLAAQSNENEEKIVYCDPASSDSKSGVA